MQTATEQTKQILIVEDEGIIAADIQSRLERLGYKVPAIARSGEEALRFARATPFDLVLMDIRLKGDMDGIDTAQTLKTEMGMSVIYITAHADSETIDRASRTEPFGYIVKPVRDFELRSAVQISIHKHEMERRLRASEAWLATTLRSIGEGVIATNTRGEVVFLNPVGEKLTGWSAADAHGRRLMEVLALREESTGSAVVNPVTDLLAGQGAPAWAHRAYRLTSRAGATATVELACFENRADKLLGAVLVLHDIGGRRELERRVMQSQRMEAIANLAAGLAHDFNNQLTVILGCADELSESLSNGDRDSAIQIKHAGSLATALTTQLLTLSRHQATRAEPLNINASIVEMQPAISSALGKTRVLTTHLGPNLGLVRADRNQLKQVLLNLSLNARDAMPLGGELRIETSNADILAGSPRALLFPPGAYVRMLVSDCGEGMDPDTLARIFEPFFTTKKPGFGTGLGLSMVYSIVAQSGGHVTARSEVGLGTAFEILLPRLAASRRLRDVEGERAVAAASGAGVMATVMLVEDEESVRGVMHQLFEKEGYQLLEASDGCEAEVIAAQYNEPIHVLVADVEMPGVSGPQLADRLAAMRPDIPDIKVLFVSGKPHAAMGRERGVLPKPFSPVDLLGRVRALMECPRPA
ncbi:MAG TPA: response regulator [Bryobacteraceae bacterium]|jgi:two-component system, cell cycle sensor histidine kinase and response regulator CckA|nr:response regulator [Bryobacteraceae bacterium]